jgi:hypothetical protein
MSLTTDCCGFKLTQAGKDAVARGELNFVDGKWSGLLWELVDSGIYGSIQADISTTTETDPNGIKPNAPGAKLDAGKLDPSLLEDFSLALQEVAVVATLGAKKYSRGGWQKVPNGVERYKAAMWRHILKSRYHVYDETVLEGHKVMHLAQVAWNALASLELLLRQNPEIAIAPKMGGCSSEK